jgi:hypothetical protein
MRSRSNSASPPCQTSRRTAAIASLKVKTAFGYHGLVLGLKNLRDLERSFAQSVKIENNPSRTGVVRRIALQQEIAALIASVLLGRDGHHHGVARDRLFILGPAFFCSTFRLSETTSCIVSLRCSSSRLTFLCKAIILQAASFKIRFWFLVRVVILLSIAGHCKAALLPDQAIDMPAHIARRPRPSGVRLRRAGARQLFDQPADALSLPA